MSDKPIEIEILPDGSVKIFTPGISAANHRAADDLIDGLLEALGGDYTKARNDTHTRSHRHGLNA